MTQSFNRAVVEVKVSDLQAAGQAFGRHGITVVLGGDIGPAGLIIAYRMVSPSVAEFKLESLAAEGAGDELVSQANTHHRFGSGQSAHGIDRVAEQRRVARSG